tara:strand:- start:4831 stop:5394 length:564 start_codon:yes stop_codon:yes gene_type:complete
MKKSSPEIQIQFSSEYDEEVVYEDRLPEGVTEEDVKEEFGKLVWCQFHDCFWNKKVEGLQRTWGTIAKNPNYEPIGSNPKEAVFQGICTRPDQIALKFKEIRNGNGIKMKVPYCFTSASNGKTGHMDFSKLLQSDGTPYGGNIDSQSPSMGGMYHDPFSGASMGRERIVKYGSGTERPAKSHTVGDS